MDKERIIQELDFKAVRSSGAGGQHVNKVSSKVELYFNVTASNALSENEKERIYSKIGNRLTKDNMLILYSDESRSQHKNQPNGSQKKKKNKTKTIGCRKTLEIEIKKGTEKKSARQTKIRVMA